MSRLAVMELGFLDLETFSVKKVGVPCMLTPSERSVMDFKSYIPGSPCRIVVAQQINQTLRLDDFYSCNMGCKSLWTHSLNLASAAESLAPARLRLERGT
jgi:hypothetical protein